MNFKITLLNLVYPLIIIFTISSHGFAQNDTSASQSTKQSLPKDEQSLNHGEELFVANCQRCHFICEQSIGPSLAGINKRKQRGWLISFIKNSQAMITSGDQYSQHLLNSYSNLAMPDFDYLSDGDILSILSYIDEQTKNTYDNVEHPENAIAKDNVDLEINTKADRTNYYEKSIDAEIPVSEASVTLGKQLFNDNCAECHEMCMEKIGPPLATVTDRRPLSWLIDFIQNPQKIIESGDPYANFLWENYDVLMTPSFLEEDDILNILSYIRHESGSPVHVAGTNSPNSYEPDSIPREPVESQQDKRFDEGEEKNGLTVEQISLMIVVVLTIIIFAYFLIKIYRNLHRNKSRNE